MIYPWMGPTPAGTPFQDTYARKHHVSYVEQTQTGVIVYLEIDNRKCTTISESSDFCFQTASAAAEFLAAKASKHTLSQSFPIYQVNGSNDVINDLDSPANVKYVLFGIVLVFCIGALILIVVTTQRKRAAGITWFPEGFLRNNSGPRRRSRRRGPEGQELRNLNKNASIGGMEIEHGQHNGHVPQWSDDESDMPQPKRFRGLEGGYASDHTGITDYEEAAEPRHWSQQHLEAADIKPISMLTPPSHADHNDINARGPCGMTPIMVSCKNLIFQGLKLFKW